MCETYIVYLEQIAFLTELAELGKLSAVFLDPVFLDPFALLCANKAIDGVREGAALVFLRPTVTGIELFEELDFVTFGASPTARARGLSELAFGISPTEVLRTGAPLIKFAFDMGHFVR